MSLVPDPVSNVTSTVKILAIVFAVILVFGLIGYLSYSKAQLASQVADDSGQIEALKAANNQWVNQVMESNDKLKAMQTEADKRTVVAEKAVKVADTQSATLTAAATKIQAQKPVGDDCAATKALFDQFFKVKP